MNADYRNYINLAYRVSFIDVDAAKYMLMEAPKLLNFGYDADLIRCFTWNDTPQGHAFWSNINEALQY